MDRTGLSPWLLGLGCFVTLTIYAIIMLIIVRFPDPAMYRNAIAFIAILSFFLVFYFAMGRGWYGDVLRYLAFDSTLTRHTQQITPSRRAVLLEMVLALICALINIELNEQLKLDYSYLLTGSLLAFYFIQYVLIILSIDIVFRQLVSLLAIAKEIRLDLLNADVYSSLANSMVRHVGLYIFGVCIISLSYIVFTEGELGAGEMLVVLMPWYLPGLIIISLYLVPYNLFRKRMRVVKAQELSSIAAALNGNKAALRYTLLREEPEPTKIDLLYYQDRIKKIREWPFTDRIRALVLFGILPPMTWVIAALIEIMIESSL